jgi:hypothetical protein
MLTIIGRNKSNSYGAAHSAYLKQEIAALEAENAIIDKSVEITQAQIESDKDMLMTKYGATFDDLGNISNFHEI